MKKTNLTAALAVASFMMAQAVSANDDDYGDLFNGTYGSLQVGAGIVKLEGSTFIGPFKETNTSLLAGGTLGWRKSLSRIVVGVEAEGNYYSAGSDIRYGLSGIAGLKIRESDRDLAYVRVGYGKLARNGEDLEGMVIGGGYEFQITNDANMRFDYKKLNYKDVNFPDNVVNYDGHEIAIGMVFRF